MFMFDECDICGRETEVHKYRIEGAEVVACSSCGRHGTLIEDNRRAPSRKTGFNSGYSSSPQSRGFTPKPKTQNQPRYSKNRAEKVLVEHYGRAITSARDKMGITRQELAKSLFIRETLLTKIESENIRPNDDVIKKIEKALNIILFEDSSEPITQVNPDQAPARNMTLGDFATIRKKKD